ncbi:MAG: MbnP family copper-binding protein [Pseudomonadota bacterium]|nr:MbnP family copper-binding protein [Pseudomonadota bacterium]
MLNRSKNAFQTTVLAASVALLAGCGGSDDSTTAPVATAKTQPVQIEFVAMAGDLRINCGDTITNLGTTNTSAKLRDLRFYASDIHLIDANDKEVPVTLSSNEWQRDGVVLIDLEDGADICNTQGTAKINAKIVGTVPAGTYTGVGYTVGVPLSQNHSDWSAQAAPLDIQAMAWSWQSGRKFLKIEINPTTGVIRPAKTNTDGTSTPEITQSTFNIHLGSTGCAGTNPAAGQVDTCERPNRMAYHSHSFNANTQRIAVDVKGLLVDSNINQDLSGPFGCMAGATDPECVAIFDQLKIDLTTGQPIDSGHGQGLFKVVPKSGALATDGTATTAPTTDAEQHNHS